MKGAISPTSRRLHVAQVCGELADAELDIDLAVKEIDGLRLNRLPTAAAERRGTKACGQSLSWEGRRLVVHGAQGKVLDTVASASAPKAGYCEPGFCGGKGAGVGGEQWTFASWLESVELHALIATVLEGSMPQELRDATDANPSSSAATARRAYLYQLGTLGSRETMLRLLQARLASQPRAKTTVTMPSVLHVHAGLHDRIRAHARLT